MGAYIPDGYTAKGYIDEERNGESVLWDACRFKFRPATAPEVESLNLLASPQQVEQKKVEFLVKHLVEWDLKHDGKVLPIDAEVMGRLLKGFRSRLMSIVDGSYHSDVDPLDTEATVKIDLAGAAGN